MAGFVLFVDDFMGGISGMSNSSVGAYIKLLCFQWSNNGIPHDPKKIKRIVSADNEKEFDEIWEEIKGKFQKEEGILKNKKLEFVRMVAIEQTQKKAEAGRLGGQKTQAKRRSSDASSDAKANPNPNLNPILLIPKEDKERGSRHFVPPTLQDVVNYRAEINKGADAAGFIDFYESKGWLVGRASMKDWKAAYRRSDKWDKKEKPKGNKENWL